MSVCWTNYTRVNTMLNKVKFKFCWKIVIITASRGNVGKFFFPITCIAAQVIYIIYNIIRWLHGREKRHSRKCHSLPRHMRQSSLLLGYLLFHTLNVQKDWNESTCNMCDKFISPQGPLTSFFALGECSSVCNISCFDSCKRWKGAYSLLWYKVHSVTVLELSIT